MELRKASDFVPPVNSAIISAFEKVVKREIEELKNGATKEFKHPNVTKEEFEALQELVHDGDMIIKPADKGGAVVIMDKLKYIAEIDGQLKDEKVYQKLNGDPKFNIMGEIKNCLQEALNKYIIDQDLMDYLYVEFSRTPVLYTTPKIHKSLIDPPGRPIVSGVDSVFSRIGTFLDKVLNPIAKSCKSYIKDTTDFLNKLETIKLEGEVILASFDVISLYTSIQHKSGIRAVEKKLSTIEVSLEGQRFLLKLLEIILRRSYFLFGDTYYSQQRGTAMGASMAPAYANLVMSVLEEDLVYVSHHLQHVMAWWRYIDDIFLLCTGTERELITFHEYLNVIDQTIKFTLISSRSDIQFLDVSIKQMNGKLTTTLFTKKTDKNNLLTFDSQHPRSMVRSIPLSQLLRVRRIVKEDNETEGVIDKLVKKNLERGYPKGLLKEVKDRTLRKDRRELLKKNTEKKPLTRIPCVMTYTEESKSIAEIIRKHWSMLGKCLPNIKEFGEPPLFSYRRSKNIKDQVVKSDIGPLKKVGQTTISGLSQKGCFPCLSCVNCTYMIKGSSFKHPETNKEYRIRQYLTCNSDYVIYLLECPCKLWYIGETTGELKTRINNHRHSIRKKRLDLPVSKHFTEAKHTERDLKFRIIDGISTQRRGGDRTALLKKLELRWIYELNTLKPKGLNVEFKIHPSMYQP
ncbi:uncharacterized protein LOC143798719 [Ranitomeya variabilis]|uniref:uncharacterized protein LOC143798719 n=1 Tax=Ranitomeya variabilis TaxID=490064 RepID=UPI0040565AB4